MSTRSRWHMMSEKQLPILGVGEVVLPCSCWLINGWRQWDVAIVVKWGDLRSGAPRIQSQTMEKRESGMKSSYLWLILCLCSMINNSFVSIFMQFSVVVKTRGAFGAVLVVLWVDVVVNLLSPYPVSNVNRRETTSRPNWITGPGPKSEPAGKSESRGPENWVSRWRRPNSDIYSQNHHFGLVYDMIYQFLGMDANNYKFGMFCQQCHPSVASGDADIRPRNASRIHTCHLFTL